MKRNFTNLFKLSCCAVFAFNSVVSYAGTVPNTVKAVNSMATVPSKFIVQLNQKFTSYEVYTINPSEINAIAMMQSVGIGKNETFPLNLEFGAERFDLTLQPKRLITSDFKLIIGDQITTEIPTETYQGIVNGDPNQVTAMSIRDSEFKGVFQSHGDNFFIEPLNNVIKDGSIDPNQYLIYNTKDVKSSGMTCGVENVEKTAGNLRMQNSGVATAGVCRGLQVGLFCDYPTYLAYGSDVKKITFDMVFTLNYSDAVFYSRPSPASAVGGGFDLHLRLSAVYISTVTNTGFADNQMGAENILDAMDTWAGVGSSNATFRELREFDVCIIFTNRNFYGLNATVPPNYSVYGLANNRSTCNLGSSGGAFGIIKANVSTDKLRGFLLDCLLFTHELGHTLGATHTSVATNIMNDVIGTAETAFNWGSTSSTEISNFISTTTNALSNTCFKPCDPMRPEPNFSVDTRVGCNSNLTVQFTNKTDFEVGTTYEWDFGDGTAKSTSVSPAHTYNTSGTYTVSLKATKTGSISTSTKADLIYVGGTPNPIQTLNVKITDAPQAANTAASSYMEFTAVDDIELVSMKMQGDVAGNRLFALAVDKGEMVIDSKEINIPATLTNINLNWKLEKGKTYYLICNALKNGYSFGNGLTRIKKASGSFYPQTILGLLNVTGSHATAAAATNSNIWYIGYEWQVRKLCPITVGINEMEAKNNFSVYPNPNAGNFTVNYSSNSNDKTVLEVYNTIGQVVYTKTIANNSGMNTQTIDISNLTDGAYMLKFISGNDQITKTLIKLKD